VDCLCWPLKFALAAHRRSGKATPLLTTSAQLGSQTKVWGPADSVKKVVVLLHQLRARQVQAFLAVSEPLQMHT
jgi:hypothetical protein